MVISSSKGFAQFVSTLRFLSSRRYVHGIKLLSSVCIITSAEGGKKAEKRITNNFKNFSPTKLLSFIFTNGICHHPKESEGGRSERKRTFPRKTSKKGKKLPLCDTELFSAFEFLLLLMYIKFQTRFRNSEILKRKALLGKEFCFRCSQSSFSSFTRSESRGKAQRGFGECLLLPTWSETQKGLKFYDVLCCDFISFMLI